MKFVFSPDVILCGWLGSKHHLTNWLTLFLFFVCACVCIESVVSKKVTWEYPIFSLFQLWYCLTSFVGQHRSWFFLRAWEATYCETSLFLSTVTIKEGVFVLTLPECAGIIFGVGGKKAQQTSSFFVSRSSFPDIMCVLVCVSVHCMPLCLSVCPSVCAGLIYVILVLSSLPSSISCLFIKYKINKSIKRIIIPPFLCHDRLFLILCVCLSVSLSSVCLSVCLSACLPVCLFVCLCWPNSCS